MKISNFAKLTLACAISSISLVPLLAQAQEQTPVAASIELQRKADEVHKMRRLRITPQQREAAAKELRNKEAAKPEAKPPIGFETDKTIKERSRP